MLNTLFTILMIMIFGRLIFFAFRLTWGIGKVLLSLILIPLSLIGMVIAGLIRLALPILIVVGIISLLTVPSRD